MDAQARPLSQAQKEFFKYFSIPLPADATSAWAETVMRSWLADSNRQREWHAHVKVLAAPAPAPEMPAAAEPPAVVPLTPFSSRTPAPPAEPAEPRFAPPRTRPASAPPRLAPSPAEPAAPAPRPADDPPAAKAFFQKALRPSVEPTGRTAVAPRPEPAATPPKAPARPEPALGAPTAMSFFAKLPSLQRQPAGAPADPRGAERVDPSVRSRTGARGPAEPAAFSPDATVVMRTPTAQTAPGSPPAGNAGSVPPTLGKLTFRMPISQTLPGRHFDDPSMPFAVKLRLPQVAPVWIARGAALVLLALVGLGVYVATGPFQLIHSVQHAIEANQPSALAGLVDFSALRTSFKTQMPTVPVPEVAATTRRGERSAQTTVIVPRASDKVIEQLVTPNGFISLFRPAATPAAQIGTPRLPHYTFTPDRIEEWRFESPSRFVVELSGKDGPIRSVRMSITRVGTSWVLTDMQLPVPG